MSEIDWRGPVNQLLYGLTYVKQITDEVVERIAQNAVQRRALGLGPEVYYGAASEALASGEDLSEDQTSPHGHHERADFLRRLLARLDELRPWPEPAFTKVDTAQWPTFNRAVPLARLDASVNEVRDLLGEMFDGIGAEGQGLNALILRLKTGETVGLMGAYGPGQRVTLLRREPGDAATVRQHFQEATGFPAEKITAL
jgi:hypothetical protein